MLAPVHLFFLLALAAAPAAPVKFAAPGFNGGNVPADVVGVASEHFAQQLALQGFRVVTAAEIQSALGVERQKQLLGCSDEGSSCLAELSSALGVDGIVTGSLGRFGTRYTVNVKVVRSSDAKQLAVFSATVDAESLLPDVLSRAAREVAGQVNVALGLAPVKTEPTGGGTAWSYRKRGGLITAIAGLVVAGVGVWALSQASNDLTTLRNPATLNTAQAFAAYESGTGRTVFGWACLTVGGAAVALGMSLFLIDDAKQPIKASLFLSPSGATFVLGGTFP
jgi:hypothetical protein